MSDKQSMIAKIAAIAIIILAFGSYVYVNRGSVFAPESQAVGFVPKFRPITYDYNSQAGFYSGGHGYFYFYARNSISYRNSSAEAVWNEAHDLSNPLAFGTGNYLVLSETRGNAVRVYSPEGLMYVKYFENTVLHFQINESGFCTVRLQDGSGYRTIVYGLDGEPIYTRVHATPNVFPMASTVSANGRELAIALLDVNGVGIQTHLLLARILQRPSIADSDGEWGGGYRWDIQIIASLRYNGNNDLLAASDAKITHYRITGDGRSGESATVEFNNYVNGLEYMGDNGLILALGRGIPSLDAVPENTVQFYDESLSLQGSFAVPRAISYLHGNSQGAIVGAGQTYYGFNTRGSLQWQYNAPGELKQLIFLNGTDTVLEVGFTEARILRRERLAGSQNEYPEPPMPTNTESPAEHPETAEPIEPAEPITVPEPAEVIEPEEGLDAD